GGQALSGPNLAHEISSAAVPRLATAPKLGDFEGMAPATELARKMLAVDKFIQREPKDGSSCSQRTQAYLGYTEKNFYAVFLAFDSEPRLLRARMLRRGLIGGDDQGGVFPGYVCAHPHPHGLFFYPFRHQPD